MIVSKRSSSSSLMIVLSSSAVNASTSLFLSLFLWRGRCTFGLEPKLRHVPAKADRGEPVYFYAVFHTKDMWEDYSRAGEEARRAMRQIWG